MYSVVSRELLCVYFAKFIILFSFSSCLKLYSYSTAHNTLAAFSFPLEKYHSHKLGNQVTERLRSLGV